ncbi:hypothetical protein B0J12DRAFT_54330 [Macrophomina phaseolina]|uniref:Homeobox domain-containing protein n=1 Tax=Macrophomina phaseolina TaxID=35725 RepID=A0ABQ8GHJ6_9PEZI|nr:hypothetical protein B0J12DRAFT_54330 [Macrophomina phaseolina]
MRPGSQSPGPGCDLYSIASSPDCRPVSCDTVAPEALFNADAEMTPAELVPGDPSNDSAPDNFSIAEKALESLRTCPDDEELPRSICERRPALHTSEASGPHIPTGQGMIRRADPYPSAKEFFELHEAAGYPLKNILTWFSNTRVRISKPTSAPLSSSVYRMPFAQS